jgi:hypothetical protein
MSLPPLNHSKAVRGCKYKILSEIRKIFNKNLILYYTRRPLINYLNINLVHFESLNSRFQPGCG